MKANTSRTYWGNDSSIHTDEDWTQEKPGILIVNGVEIDTNDDSQG